jgi:hypothetical protein
LPRDPQKGVNWMTQDTHEKVITFKIDDEEVQSTEKELTELALVELGKADPATHFLQLVKGGKPSTEFKNPNELIKLHEGIEFVTVYTGPTHVS